MYEIKNMALRGVFLNPLPLFTRSLYKEALTWINPPPPSTHPDFFYRSYCA